MAQLEIIQSQLTYSQQPLAESLSSLTAKQDYTSTTDIWLLHPGPRHSLIIVLATRNNISNADEAAVYKRARSYNLQVIHMQVTDECTSHLHAADNWSLSQSRAHLCNKH